MSEKKKLRVATTSLAGCFGCHMSLLDIDERLFTLLEHVEFDRSPLTDIKTVSPGTDIGIIEGGLCNAGERTWHVLARIPPELPDPDLRWAPARSTAACRRSATTCR
jgi:coenzyme F420-reducing hydrogenase gamma subunit